MWLVLMNVLVLQSFLAILDQLQLYFKDLTVFDVSQVSTVIAFVMSASLPEKITPIECELPSHV